MSDKISILIVDDLAETRENVRKLLQFEPDMEVVGQASNGEEAVVMAREYKPDVILMDINMPGLDGISASQAIVQQVTSAQIIIMSVQSEADYLRRAMLAGARDFLMKPFTGDEINTAIRRVYESRPALIAQPMPSATKGAKGQAGDDSEDFGKIIAVFSPKGGSGCSTIAANIAVAMAEAGENTLLIDASLMFGDVAVLLNMKPSATIIDLIDRIHELDKDLLSSVIQKHRSGLNVLLAPPRPEMAELVKEEHFQQLLPLLAETYDFIIIDTASHLSDMTLLMLDAADRILLVTQQNLPNLTGVSRFFDLTEELDYPRDKIVLVVNRASSKLRISVKDVASTLKKPIIMAIPADDLVVNQAVNQGEALVRGQYARRPVGEALIKLSHRLLEQFREPEEELEPVLDDRNASRLGRLFGSR